jgi:hypothetical protein
MILDYWASVLPLCNWDTTVLKNFFVIFLFANAGDESQTLNRHPEPTRVKHLSGAPVYGRLQASPPNIRLGWKSLPGTNTSLLGKSVCYSRKKFYSTCPRKKATEGLAQSRVD